MKLKKFRKRVRHSLKEAGLAEVVPEVKKPSQYLLGSLLAFALILIVGYLVLPFALHPKPRVKAPSLPILFYKLTNHTDKTWKAVELTVEGKGPIVGSNSAHLKSSSGNKYVFEISDITIGQEKDVTVYVQNRTPGLYGYSASFKLADGTLVSSPDDKTVEIK